ncbi:MAG: DUF1266 domain-containing protein [Clostridiales bacterium]|jgi:hypothetical protein|nr:DUF1266 domain-containing protein [Clostridiales bacterium]
MISSGQGKTSSFTAPPGVFCRKNFRRLKASFLLLCALSLPVNVYAAGTPIKISVWNTWGGESWWNLTPNEDPEGMKKADVERGVDWYKYEIPHDPPEMADGRLMLPLWPLRYLGAQVKWDEKSGSLTITRASKTIKMKTGSKEATINGDAATLDEAPYVRDGQPFFPARFVLEALSYNVELQGDSFRIWEDESAFRDTTTKAWILGCQAILGKKNKNDVYAIGMPPDYYDPAGARRELLASSWNINSNYDLMRTIFSMTDHGHNENFKEETAAIRKMGDLSKAPFTEKERAFLKQNLAMSDKWGERGIVAWDLFRMMQLISWGYGAGYLSLDSAYVYAQPVADRLKENFSSWDEATENYMDGYAWWSRTLKTDEGTEYKERLQIYDDLKAAQKTDGTLFDPKCWSEPVGIPGAIKFKFPDMSKYDKKLEFDEKAEW